MRTYVENLLAFKTEDHLASEGAVDINHNDFLQMLDGATDITWLNRSFSALNGPINAPTHLRNILALEGTYTRQQIAEALSEAHRMSAYSSECIINLLGQRERPQAQPGPLHLTRPGDQLDIETPQADLSIYDHPSI